MKKFTFFLLFCLMLSCILIAETFQVTKGYDSLTFEAGTLRYAIDKANKNGETDTIVFNLPSNTVITLLRQLVIYATKKNEGLNIKGPGQNKLVISGDGQCRIFFIWSENVIVNIENITLQKGFADQGGAILNDGKLTISNCTISHNIANSGGGVFNWRELAISNCIISHNKADNGGGVNGDGSKLTISNCTISQNNAKFKGGGINIFEPSTISNCTISYNTSEQGGGIENRDCELEITNSTIAYNTAKWGGGIRSFRSKLIISNCTVSNNNAHDSEGGIRFMLGEFTLMYSTIVYNKARTVGGISVSGNSSVAATIVANNEANNVNKDYHGSVTSYGYNFIGITREPQLWTIYDIVGIGNHIDPKLEPLANNGGPTKTHALKPGSKAMGQVDPNSFLPPHIEFPKFDQRGKPRLVKTKTDIGAVEMQLKSTLSNNWR